MNKRFRFGRGLAVFGIIMSVFFLAACGSDGGSKSSIHNITFKATALNTGTVVAAAPKLIHLDTMFAFLSGKEAVAGAGNCPTGDGAKEFDLFFPGSSVCLTSAVIVYEEIEFEQEGVVNGDEVEVGPFVLDLLGSAGDGIPASISIPVPDGAFNKVKFKIGDLDDRDNDGLKVEDSGTLDDTPKNISVADATTAGLTKKSLVIKGTAHDAQNSPNSPTNFVFTTNIEAKIIIPLDTSVLDGSKMISYIDLKTGFAKLAFGDIAPDMDGDMSTLECAPLPGLLSFSQQLACDIVKNIDLYEDTDDDGESETGEHRGDNRGTGGFDDTIPHD